MSDGLPAHCDCPADAASEGACKHRVAVAIRPPVLETAIHAQLAADGSGTSNPPLPEEEDLSAKAITQTAGARGEREDGDEADEEYPCECD
ncbi:SWIM zinc finger family protein [Halorarum halophilum]|uniref:SWIM zinc finger family protein n=1 Tax=Halorarum halophilum TaxID=2743090 RepID=UPI002AA2A425|nr:SWIM zinc finger family protein [Halobaculum halophilum]